MSDLETWWKDKAEAEIELTLPKVKAYSSVDLEIMGAALADDRKQGVEAAIAFYALGKVSRIVGSLQEDRPTESREDSWFDLGVYSRMAQRVLEVGSWPG